MHLLTPETKIRLSQIKDLKDWYRELLEDARTYHIGEISQKTGLKKCFVNGNIVWLDPKQNHDFLQGKMSKTDTKYLAKSTKPARADGFIKQTGNIKNDAIRYFNYMKKTWKTNPVTARYLNNAKIRLNNMSINHLFMTKGKARSLKEIKERTLCLPYVRDILERSGKPADHTIKNGKESYTLVGKAVVNNKTKEMQVVISRDKNSRYFYLSVFKLKK